MDEQRKLRNLLAYTKMDSVEELEDCNKLYEELLAYINKSKKEHELLELYRKFETPVIQNDMGSFGHYLTLIKQKEKEIEEMK